MNKKTPILEVKHLRKYFPITKGFLRKKVGEIKAVDDVNFHLLPGETLGIVGESGCGKSTVARTVLRALEPTSGQILFNENDTFKDLALLNKVELKQVRRNIQMIFQDPYSSLNPRQRVRDIIGEPLIVNKVKQGDELEDRVRNLMIAVGLRPEHIIRYPHAFSGGQRQRIGIARALALNPKLIFLDEPVSALDVSVQAQILNLLKDLQEEYDLTYLFISHDLGVVQHICNRVAVMYLGRLVETASVDNLFKNPQHPYTEALLSASPKPHPRFRNKKAILGGEVPSPLNTPSGCFFESRCPYKKSICKEEYPSLQEAKNSSGQFVACHFSQNLNLKGI